MSECRKNTINSKCLIEANLFACFSSFVILFSCERYKPLWLCTPPQKKASSFSIHTKKWCITITNRKTTHLLHPYLSNEELLIKDYLAKKHRARESVKGTIKE